MPTTLYFLSQKEGLKLSRDKMAADPALQVRLGIRYLKQLHQRFGNLDVALMAYNDGPTQIATLLHKRQIDEYRNWYAVDGIFFDDFNNGFTYSPATYATLNTYVKSQGMTYTMGNPGTSVSSGYIGTLDNLVIYESSGYPSLSSITYAGYPESDFALIAFGVSYSASFVASAAPLVGYMYIDNLSGGNPYYTLSSLFLQTEATLNGLDKGTSSTTTATSSTSTSSTAITTTTTTAAADPQLTISSQTTTIP